MTWWMVCKCLQTSWGLPGKLVVTSVIWLQPEESYKSLWPNASNCSSTSRGIHIFFLKTSSSQVVWNRSLAVCDLNKQELWLWLLPLYSLTGAYWLHGLINVFWASSAARGLNNKADLVFFTVKVIPFLPGYITMITYLANTICSGAARLHIWDQKEWNHHPLTNQRSGKQP